ncbi:MAG: hypothetical protein HQ547_00965 [Candidatus Omnitrophica bacterium]|nr:hypothetical protein [Candidatus Omnitrophota bacterium]
MTIRDIKEDLIGLGLGGNVDLATLLYLSLTMRKAERKISMLITGPSSAGKSYLADTVINLFPQEDIIKVSRVTPAALVKYGDLSRKVLFVYEKFKDELFAQYIRGLISEGEVIHATANELCRLQGPTTLVETTANPNIIGIENKSRCFVVGINTSEEARSNILERQKELRTIRAFPLNKETEDTQRGHKEFQENLDPTIDVIIPYAKRIKLHTLAQHAPRILERVLNVITAIGFLEQGKREVKELNGHRYIEAEETDFYIAKEILQKLPIDETESILPEDTVKFIETLRAHRNKLYELGTFTRGHLFDIINKSDYPHRSSKVVIKHLSVLNQIGFIDERPVRGLKNRCEYTLNKAFTVLLTQRSPQNCYATLSLT